MAVKYRPSTIAIYPTHSTSAVLASLLVTRNHLQMKHLQMVRGHVWEDTLSIPIIENKATEDDIDDVIEQAVRDNLGVDTVLIRARELCSQVIFLKLRSCKLIIRLFDHSDYNPVAVIICIVFTIKKMADKATKHPATSVKVVRSLFIDMQLSL